jgi:hypothetical protein
MLKKSECLGRFWGKKLIEKQQNNSTSVSASSGTRTRVIRVAGEYFTPKPTTLAEFVEKDLAADHSESSSIHFRYVHLLLTLAHWEKKTKIFCEKPQRCLFIFLLQWNFSNWDEDLVTFGKLYKVNKEKNVSKKVFKKSLQCSLEYSAPCFFVFWKVYKENLSVILIEKREFSKKREF